MIIYFWQRIVSPHMAGLAAAMADRGHAVTYVANIAMSEHRAAQGWRAADVGRARLIIASSPSEVRDVVEASPAGAIHLTQGLRSNGLVRVAQRALRYRNSRIWLIHEKVNDRGFRGIMKRNVYRLAYRGAKHWAEKLLAIGEGTDLWASAQGFPRDRISPFAYFLNEERATGVDQETKLFTFCFAGRLIQGKRLDLLLNALSNQKLTRWTLDIVGEGTLGPRFKNQFEKARLPTQVRWHGTVSNAKAREIIAAADCLVLPSDHDGWGAVISEALLAGTRVICSSACGSATAVREDECSDVFKAGDTIDLTSAITATLSRGRVTALERERRKRWATSLGAPSGAMYLEALIEGCRAPVPWKK